MRETMKYFIDKMQAAAEGHTRFYEFQKGRTDCENDENQHWKADSLFMEDAVVRDLQLDSLFTETLENYDFTGDNFVNRHQWEMLVKRASEVGGKWQEVIEVLSSWADDTFTGYDCFTIIGL